MQPYQILTFAFLTYLIIGCCIADAFLDRKQYKKQIRQLQRENATLRGKLNAKEYNYHE